MYCCSSSQGLKLTVKLTTNAKIRKENYGSHRCQKKSCFWSPWQQSCWSHYCFHTARNREVFQRAPFIVQITNGTFMPSDKWQMIIYPDTTETTHLSNRYTHTKHTVDVCVCVYVCALQRCSSVCAIIGSCHIWRK